jgi:hypothetical protein
MTDHWKPRGSALGGYFACDLRAAFDRAIHDGIIAPAGCESSSYADFGTLCHYELMANQLRLEFPDGKEAPTEEQKNNAASLFSDLEACMDRVVAVSARAAQHVPKPPEGATWLAETAYKQDWLQGHIDFISSDGSVIGDLKTTSRKPDHGKAKAEHLYQLYAYTLLAEAEGADIRSGWILYEGSMRDWSLLVSIDLASPESKQMRTFVRQYVDYLMGTRLAKQAVPHFGHHCTAGFCPHTARCHNLIVPPAGVDPGVVGPDITIAANPFGAIA